MQVDLLPEVLLLPPLDSKSGEDEAPAKAPTFSYYDQIRVYSELEAFKSGISKEDFVVISNLQRLDRIFALKKLEPISALSSESSCDNQRMRILQTLMIQILTVLSLQEEIK